MNPMTPIYAALIQKDVKKLEDVPAKLREDVKKYMEDKPND